MTDDEIVAMALAENGYDGPDGSYEKSLARDVALDALRIAREQSMPHLPPGALCREIEPPIGTWVKDRFGATSYHRPGGWGEPGFLPFGKWQEMWDARGPYVLCGPWGQDLERENEG